MRFFFHSQLMQVLLSIPFYLKVHLERVQMIFPLLFLAVCVNEMYLFCYFSTRITSTVRLQSIFLWVCVVECWEIVLFFCVSQYDTIPYAVNFVNILQSGDLKTSKALVLFIKAIDSRPIKIETVSFVRYEMTLEMFLTVLSIFIWV